MTILTSEGSGSGDLVSNDGYMVTNAHVVGDEKQVRVRWSDGIETTAEVVRVAKERDVALIKTNPRDRDPLPIKRGAVTPGARLCHRLSAGEGISGDGEQRDHFRHPAWGCAIFKAMFP